MVAMMINKLSVADNLPVDTYGKVIDQNGEPVVGAKVHGILKFEEKRIKEKHDTETDADGRFQFLGFHAKGLTMVPEKEGYEFNSKILSTVNRPSNYIPDPKDPLVFMMYKLRGGEPMKHNQIYSSVPCDGSVEPFNLLDYRSNRTIPYAMRVNGDLMVTLIRTPLKLNARDGNKPFNWSVNFAITNGGLMEIPTNNIYSYEAPVDGYRPMITMNFPTNMVGWQYEFKRDYFFKARNGQIYGRMTLHVDASRTQPPTYFDAEIYANPNGSRNLEFDPQKQIR